MKVFISSTSRDLGPYRAAAAEVVRDSQCEALLFEHFPIDPTPIVALCNRFLDQSDVVLLLQAFRRGWVPSPAQGGDGLSSITGLEIAAADEVNKPVLAFLADETHWPGSLWESDDPLGLAWVKNFRNGLNRNAKFFRHETDSSLPAFRALLSQQLANFLLARGTSQAPVPEAETIELRRPSSPAALPPTPYPLLSPYDDPRTFAGRDMEIERLSTLVNMPQLILAVYGPSGAGKSSLMQAGLKPRLESAGWTVSFERCPGEPGLAARLLRDVLARPESFAAPDDAPDTPSRFATWIGRAFEKSGRRIVFILDQIDSFLRDPELRDDTLARLGPLLGATAQRMPGVQGYACKWILCYRQEYDGEVRGWLTDVLAPARRRGRNLSLPHQLADPQRRLHDYVVPVMGAAPPGDFDDSDPTVGLSYRAFLDAIQRPLLLTGPAGEHFGIKFSEASASRLAMAFANARREMPDAPLVPEFQVVVNHLIETAAGQHRGPSPIWVEAPQHDGTFTSAIRRALADHLVRSLKEAFPGNTNAARVGRSRVLLVLRDLAAARVGAGRGFDKSDLVRRLDPGGSIALENLAAPNARLVFERDGLYFLSHDLLAEVIEESVSTKAGLRHLDIDEGLWELRRFVHQRVELLQLGDQAACKLTRNQRKALETASQSLLVLPPEREWWQRCRLQRQRSHRRWGLCLTAGLLVIGLSVQPLYHQFEIYKLRSQLKRVIYRADFAPIAQLAREYPFDWSAVGSVVEPQPNYRLIWDETLPTFFSDVPWAPRTIPSLDILEVIDRSHILFIGSRPVFGAMYYAVETTWLGAIGVANYNATDRAEEVMRALRRDFIVYHRKVDPNFQQPPPSFERDPLNPVVTIPGREAIGQLGARYREPDLIIQQHEVTNEEYRRFDPSHTFPSGRERYPVTQVSWWEAAAYAGWMGASLPTPRQWITAIEGEQNPPLGKLDGSVDEWTKDLSPNGRRLICGYPAGGPPIKSCEGSADPLFRPNMGFRLVKTSVHKMLGGPPEI